LVAGLGYIGLGVARDAVTAGYHVTGFGTEPEHAVRLITGLAGEDHTATVLAEAIESGVLYITGDTRSCAAFDTTVLVPDGRPVDPAETGALERLAVALAPQVRAGVLVVVAETPRPRADGELLSATVELLSGMRAGKDFDLGYAVAAFVSSTPTVPTIVSGVDDRSARRTAALYRNLGRTATAVVPAEAAELVTMLQIVLMTQTRLDHGEAR
jgi:UDP-N-acetyl-D-mannosaminuronate dehydrogenase